MAKANSRLKTILEREQKQYETDIENLTDSATDVIDEVLRRGRDDPRDVIRDYVRDASQLANDHYERQRQLWAEYAGIDMPDYDHMEVIDPDRVLWQQQGGFANTDFNGLTFTQVKEGRSRAGMTIDDLWPRLDNIDDAQQFIADMITTSARVTMQRDIREDPTEPRWGRFCHGTKPCSFCVMLASRGYKYTSRESADFGGSFHNGKCRCTVEPSWGEDDIILDQQAEWADMTDKARRHAGTSEANALTVAMNHLFPDKVRGGVYELSAPWPEDILHVSGRIWTHIITGDPTGKGGHAAWSKIPGKTHFPDTWDEAKLKWAVNETIAAPDSDMQGVRPLTRILNKTIEGVQVTVKLTKRKNGWRVSTAFPDVKDKRGVNS